MANSGLIRSRKYREELKGCFTKESVKNQFEDYCSRTSIHGVQYVGDSKRPLYERWWWLVIFILSSLLNGFLIYRMWAKWKDSPVIVAFRETTTPVWEVPFPAVTLCLQVNSRKHQFNMGDSLKKDDTSEEEEEKRGAMSLLCDEDLTFSNSSDYLNQTMIDFLIEVAPDLSETLEACFMRHDETNCSDIFKPVFTEDGLCFTYNVLNHSEIFRDEWSVYPYPRDLPKAEFWSLDKGYEKHSPIDVYPQRGFDSGDRAGIYFLVAGNLSNQDSICRGPIPGYKILLHNPAEIPFSSVKYTRVPVNQEMLMLMTPNIMTTSPSLHSYPPSVRQCFYPDERYLKYFKVYTERNCELECLTNYTLKSCGCAAIYMPRNENTPVCGGGKKDCVTQVAYDIRMEELKKSKEGETEDYCNCLPACTSITYTAETSQAVFDWRKTYEAIQNLFPDDLSNVSSDYSISQVKLFFTDTQFTTTHRSELYGIVDFLANCGGLLGLCSGISFLSFLEIFYFLTIRYWANVKKNNKHPPIQAEEENMLSINT